MENNANDGQKESFLSNKTELRHYTFTHNFIGVEIVPRKFGQFINIICPIFSTTDHTYSGT